MFLYDRQTRVERKVKHCPSGSHSLEHLQSHLNDFNKIQFNWKTLNLFMEYVWHQNQWIRGLTKNSRTTLFWIKAFKKGPRNDILYENQKWHQKIFSTENSLGYIRIFPRYLSVQTTWIHPEKRVRWLQQLNGGISCLVQSWNYLQNSSKCFGALSCDGRSNS